MPDQQLPPGRDPVLLAVGDAVCTTSIPRSDACQQAAVSDIILKAGPDVVALLGDLQYQKGEFLNFRTFYDPSYGRFKGKTRPVPGNHEYYTANAKGYYDYFNGVGAQTGLAGDRRKGYYSYDVGAWHIIALNSNCEEIGGCGEGSAQEQWLRQDLAANPVACTLAYWHHPRFSSGDHGTDTTFRAFWQALYDYDAELVLVGHDHDYERFAPQTATGERDDVRGIRQIVVGTGGMSHGPLRKVKPNSEVLDRTTFGALQLTLKPTTYSWQFLAVPGGSLADSGTVACHGTPGRLAFTPVADATIDATSPTGNYGRDTLLVAGWAPPRRALLRFEVDGIGERTIAKAKLRLFVVGSSTSSGEVNFVNDSTWSETAVTWETAPTLGAPVQSIGASAAGTWLEVDVTSAVKRDGTYTFGLSSAQLGGTVYISREGAAWNAPRLIVDLR